MLCMSGGAGKNHLKIILIVLLLLEDKNIAN